MKDNTKNFILLHILLLLYSLSGILSKVASKQEWLSPEFFIYYVGVICILFLYALLWQQLIKRMQISYAYANKAVNVIWGIIWGGLIFHEKIKLQNIVGAFFIVIGIMIMSKKGE